MSKHRVTFVPAMLCLAMVVGAIQETPAAPATAQAENRPWNLTLNGGLTINSGNTRSRVFNGEIDFSVRLDGSEFSTLFDTLYGRSGNEVIQKKGKWDNAFTHGLNKRLNLFGQLVLEYDAIAGITLRTTTGLGLSVDIHDKEAIKTRLTASLNGEFLDPGGDAPFQRSLRLQITLATEAHISASARIKARVLYTPDMADFRRDYRVEVDAALSLLMKKPLWITIKLQDRFNNFPASGGIKKNDLTLITSISIRF